MQRPDLCPPPFFLSHNPVTNARCACTEENCGTNQQDLYRISLFTGSTPEQRGDWYEQGIVGSFR